MLKAGLIHWPIPNSEGSGSLLDMASRVYRPLLALLRTASGARVTVNINGALAERLDREKFGDILSGLREMAQDGRIELTGSAKYEPILALIPKDESRRQIRLNEEANRAVFGDAYRPRGFFPPALAVSPELLRTVFEMGYSWCLADEIGYGGKLRRVPRDRLFDVEGVPGLRVHFVERQPSSKGEFSLSFLTPSAESFESPDPVTISELERRIPRRDSIMPVRSSLRTSEADIRSHGPFAAWQNPADPVHQDFWSLVQRTIDAVGRADVGSSLARSRLDEALNASSFCTRAGARRFLSVLELLGSAVPASTVDEARASVHRIDRQLREDSNERI